MSMGPATVLPPIVTPAILDVEAQTADYTEKHRNQLDARSWRRIAMGLLIALIIASVQVVILSLKYQHDVFVFRETPKGFTYAGQASQELTPDNFAIGQQLGLFVQAFRDVPGDDLTADRNITRLLAMTSSQYQTNTQAQIRNYFGQDSNNPKMLRRKFTRTVRLGVDAIHDPGTDTWRMTWIEDMTVDGKTTPSLHEGVIRIAPDPHLPTDNNDAMVNAPGVIVVQYELH